VGSELCIRARYVAWQKVPGKNKTRRYAYLKEKLIVPGGVNSRHVAYLGKEPIAAIEKLYREGRLSLEQVLSISERKFPEVAELKQEIQAQNMAKIER
jgi:hypothetical protein